MINEVSQEIIDSCKGLKVMMSSFSLSFSDRKARATEGVKNKGSLIRAKKSLWL